MACERRFEGDKALNYAVKWDKSALGRGKAKGKGLDVRACQSKEEQEVCLAGGECKGRKVTKVQ